MTRVHIACGDLTAWEGDAIVNAANNDLILGGGLAGAIARRGGPSIQQECSAHGPVRVGEAALTGAGKLPARYVIHQASMALGGRTTEESLRRSTRAVLDIAEQKEDIHTLAFPAVGTGIAGFDMTRCAEVMLEEVKRHIDAGSTLTDIHFVLLEPESREIFRKTWNRIAGTDA